jgi:hypothetical protein
VHPPQHLHVIADAPQNFIRSAQIAEAQGTYREGNSEGAREAVSALNAQNAQSFVEQHLMRLAQDYPQIAQTTETRESAEPAAESEVVSVTQQLAAQDPRNPEAAQGDMRDQVIANAAAGEIVERFEPAAPQPQQPQPQQADAPRLSQPQITREDTQRQAAQQESVQRQQEAQQPQQRAQQPQAAQEDIQRQASVTGAPAASVVI